MNRFVVWHHVLTKGTSSAAMLSPVVRAILDGVARHGIGTVAADPADARGAGIVFFDEGGPAVVERIRQLAHGGIERVVAVATSMEAASTSGCWPLLDHAASDLLVCAPERDITAEIVARLERWAEVDRLVESPMVRQNLVGTGRAWTMTLRRLVEIARFSDAPVLLLGETGTGKELASRLIHALDPRPAKRSLVVVDCGAIAPELSGSEFFGHVKGAFTGALEPREGAFALADGGTLFLDEVGELPLHLQTELLRAIQERVYKRLGSNVWHDTAFRLVCATNRDLPASGGTGHFRRDLYYRIASTTIVLPPLRDRPDDIIPLAEHFVEEQAGNRPVPQLDESVRAYLTRREYHGNIRELRHLVMRMMQRHVGSGPITAGDVPEDERPAAAPEAAWIDDGFATAVRRAIAKGVGMKEIGRAATEVAIDVAVEMEGSLQNAARRLGVTDRALQIRRAARREQVADDTPALA